MQVDVVLKSGSLEPVSNVTLLATTIRIVHKRRLLEVLMKVQTDISLDQQQEDGNFKGKIINN